MREKVPLLGARSGTFDLAGRLCGLGIKGS
jgi:hypothetical protein